MTKLIPIAIIAFLIYLGLRYFKTLPNEKRKPFVIKWLVYSTIGLLLAAFATGRIHWLGAVAAGLLGAFKFGASYFIRFLPFLRILQNNKIFGAPVFRTPFLVMTLDLKTGEMSGEILDGEFSGSNLKTLSESELETFETYLKTHDKRGYYLLRVWRQRDQQSSSGTRYESVDDPSIEEARMILGLNDKFTIKDVDYAYKRLMQKLHPDRGGNDYLASRVNRARDLLTAHLNKQN